ncbi:hypothetical protein DPMN_055214 [Dreissena polymorpha]|uniref:Uncharacterized protein n=1 Tax=Dreissena polymorpha TaxID=45954 RepID=A0A9D4CRD4_DREPO|nr:hypothetical protein DPMN_055214 [Dreissena polymorpha]
MDEAWVKCITERTGFKRMDEAWVKCITEHTGFKRMAEEGVKCITEHTGFKANCLHPDVIEVSFNEFLDVNGPIGDEEPLHE